MSVCNKFGYYGTASGHALGNPFLSVPLIAHTDRRPNHHSLAPLGVCVCVCVCVCVFPADFNVHACVQNSLWQRIMRFFLGGEGT